MSAISKLKLNLRKVLNNIDTISLSATSAHWAWMKTRNDSKYVEDVCMEWGKTNLAFLNLILMSSHAFNNASDSGCHRKPQPCFPSIYFSFFTNKSVHNTKVIPFVSHSHSSSHNTIELKNQRPEGRLNDND